MLAVPHPAPPSRRETEEGKTRKERDGTRLGFGVLGVPLARKLSVAGVLRIDQDPNCRARLQGRKGMEVRGSHRLAVDRFPQLDSYIGGTDPVMMVRHAGHNPASRQAMSLRVARLADRGGDDRGRVYETPEGAEDECQAYEEHHLGVPALGVLTAPVPGVGLVHKC